MKRSTDLPSVIGPVVGAIDHYPAGHAEALRSHERAQVVHALTGVMSVTTEAASHVLPPHRAIWLPAGAPYEIFCRGPVTFNWLSVDPVLPDGPMEPRVFDVPLLVRALIQEVLAFDHDAASEAREGQIVRLLIDEIARMPATPLSAPMPGDRRLRRVCDVIVGDPADQRDLDALAKEAGMGRRTFTRAFRAETGMAFATWRQQIRLMAALSMLGEGRPITAIAYDVGYESPSSFTAMFHRVLGVPPSHYGRSRA
ncbi:helix-turn-helix transcriptional regulator [Sphingomonas sp. CGMCC 1.13654]|uniref:Helix-turn-helix transcriptional regulator n=1 Tax=Sphingomonas chungangi TaxID=2683589 RepID=A0A838L528_9SPHN|nr:helix-turn-helix transcriptional regulator [Sphingomonas chungangi]MBA2934000.1 helix-turn-helix transcriptional regulator [Sphingomonas chungangi]MVW57746.1 helix-turn-helix domain-containing protein [Sphingomonas chungangi]